THSKTIRKGDKVFVLSGNDKGKIGAVLAFMKDKVVVEGVNVRVKNIKKSREHPKGKRINIECPVHISNVRLSIDGKKSSLIVRFNEGRKEIWNRQPDGKEVLYRVVKEKKD
ncbi:MAG: 50S ribosomal protein L24, partial [Victivallaceae bacterium]